MWYDFTFPDWLDFISIDLLALNKILVNFNIIFIGNLNTNNMLHDFIDMFIWFIGV